MSEQKLVRSICPKCQQTFSFEVSTKFFHDNKSPQVPFVIHHCGNTFITYIDHNFKVRSINAVFSSLDFNQDVDIINCLDAQPLNKKLLDKMTLEDRTRFICEIGCENVDKESIPNVLDKTIVSIIAKKKEITLAELILKLHPLEKALNRQLGTETILKVLHKYIEKGIISKQIISAYDGVPDTQFSKITEPGEL